MGKAFALQVLASVAVPLLAVWLTVRATSRETIRAVRTEVSAQRLIGLADELAQTSRSLRDLLFAGDACASCGRGISARRLIEAASHVDRSVDLALVHVRNDELRRSLHRVLRAAGDATRHRKSLSEPCDQLLNATYSLIAVCDQTAEHCLNLLHEGRAVIPPRVPINHLERFLTATLGWVR